MVNFTQIMIHQGQSRQNINGQKEGSIERLSRMSQVNQGPVRIKADDQSIFILVGYFAITLSFLFFIFFLAILVVPKSTEDLYIQQQLQGTNLRNCSNFLELNSTDIVCKTGDNSPMSAGMYVHSLSPLNQFLVFQLVLSQHALSGVDSVNEMVTLKVYKAESYQDQNGQTRLRAGDLFLDEPIHLKERTKTKGIDYQFALGYMSKLSSDDEYYWEVKFDSNSVFSASDRFYIKSTVVRESFSIFTIVIRAVLFVVAVVGFCLYFHRVFSLPKQRISHEQKMVLALSVLTLTFNDPLFFVTVIAPNAFISFLSALFLATFIFCLLLLWMFFLFRIRNQQPETETAFFSGKCKLVVFGLFYLIGLTYLVLYAILMTEQHPAFSKDDINQPTVWILIIISGVGFGFYIIYVVYNFVRICAASETLQWRHKIFLVFFVIFFVGTAVLFFADAYNPYTYSASKILITFLSMNFYSFFLQYIYSPSHQQLDRHHEDRSSLICTSETETNHQAQEPIQLVYGDEASDASEITDKAIPYKWRLKSKSYLSMEHSRRKEAQMNSNAKMLDDSYRNKDNSQRLNE